MDTDYKRLPKDKQSDVQLAYESLNDWSIAGSVIDKRRPRYFYAQVLCWFAVIASAFEVSQVFLSLLVGRIGIVAVWLGAISFFVLYADSFRRKRRLERLMDESRAELRELGLEYHHPIAGGPGELRSTAPDAPFDPYDDRHFA